MSKRRRIRGRDGTWCGGGTGAGGAVVVVRSMEAGSLLTESSLGLAKRQARSRRVDGPGVTLFGLEARAQHSDSADGSLCHPAAVVAVVVMKKRLGNVGRRARCWRVKREEIEGQSTVL